MTVPKYNEMYKPFLEALKDGKQHTLKDIIKYIVKYFDLTESDISELLPSGRQTVFRNRIGWARTYLKKSGLIGSPKRAEFIITNTGKDAISDKTVVIDNNYLMRFEGFQRFVNHDLGTVDTQNETQCDKDTPDDIFERAFQEINDNLADEILSEVMKISPTSFEQMAIDLLHKMGYGAFENSGRTTAVTGDEGIDGIIMEDRLGFSLIYIQAKKWDSQSTVGRPELQNFVGAIAGKGGKGLFVTTAKFSKQAIEYAKHQHIILIDGVKLAKLMIEHNFGVRVKKAFEIKAVDSDLFNDYM
ncbi:MAG: restriction endonuclease [Cloacibacillus porcorum]|uniref:restriction endonuclease n=1 Tax=Cloacibacillus porcorum TaxID=1197717 RepID=UPI002353619F|nr:restriction endonuclease [Cloacibacillus porcorum]MCI5864690.1 restriction endonuclease [Cloacibacillus porcorum]